MRGVRKLTGLVVVLGIFMFVVTPGLYAAEDLALRVEELEKRLATLEELVREILNKYSREVSVEVGAPLSAQETVKAFFEALNRGDFSKAEEYIAPDFELPSKSGLEPMVGAIQKVEIEGAEDNPGYKRVAVKVTFKPFVRVPAYYEPIYREKQILTLKKWDGKWKISLWR